jgi:hypothetical protein
MALKDWDPRGNYGEYVNPGTGKKTKELQEEQRVAETQAELQRLKKAKDKQKADREKIRAKGRPKATTQTWNPAKAVGDAVGGAIMAPFNALSEGAQQLERAIRTPEQIAEKREADKKVRQKVEKARGAAAPAVEAAKVVLKGTGLGMVEQAADTIIETGQGVAAVAKKAVGLKVKPEEDPFRPDRYIRAETDFGLTPETQAGRFASKILGLINATRLGRRVATKYVPGYKDLKGAKKILKNVPDAAAGYVMADPNEEDAANLSAWLQDKSPDWLKPAYVLAGDADYDNVFAYRALTALEDMGLGVAADALGAGLKALGFRFKPNMANPATDIIEESGKKLDDSLEAAAKQAEADEAVEAIRWDDTNFGPRRQAILDELETQKARLDDPWDDAADAQKKIDELNLELTEVENAATKSIMPMEPGVKPMVYEAAATVKSTKYLTEDIISGATLITDAGIKNANLQDVWDQTLKPIVDALAPDKLEQMYRKFGKNTAAEIDRLNKTMYAAFEEVLESAQSSEEVTENMLKMFRGMDQTFIGEYGVEQLKSPAVLATQSMMKYLARKASNLGHLRNDLEASGIKGSNVDDKLIDSITGLIMLRKEAWSLEAGRRLALGRGPWGATKTSKTLDSAEAFGEARQLTRKMLNQWALKVKNGLRSGDPDAINEMRQMTMAMALSGGDPAKAINFAETAIKYMGQNLLGQWMNSILSGPKTLIRNFGSAIRLVGQPIELGLAGITRGDDRLVGVAGAGFTGMFTSLFDAAQVAATTIKTGIPATWDQHQIIRHAEKMALLDGMEMMAKTPAQQRTVGFMRFLNAFSEFTGIPGRLMMGGDDFIKVMAARQKIYEDAYLFAYDKVGGKMLGQNTKEFNSWMEHALIAASKKMDIKTGQIFDDAVLEYAEKATFTNPADPDNKFFSAFERLAEADINGVPVGRFMMPFVRTPANIMGYQLEMMPLASRLLGGYQKAIKEGDAIKIAEYQGREAVGSMIVSLGYTMAWSGHITGNMPADPVMRSQWREAGIPPRSVRIGDKWVSYSWFEPMSNWMAAAADLGTLERMGLVGEAEKLSSTLVFSIAAGFVEKSYLAQLDGLSFFLDPVGNYEKLTRQKERFGDPNGTLDIIAAGAFSAANSLLPYSSLRRSISNAMDPYYREYNTMFDRTLANALPGLSQTNALDRSILTGKPMLQPNGGLWNAFIPFETRDINKDPVAKTLMEIDAWPKEQLYVSTMGFRYTGKQREKLQKMVADSGLRKELEKLFNSPEFKDDRKLWENEAIPSGMKFGEPFFRARTRELISETINMAKDELEYNDPELRARIEKAMELKARQESSQYAPLETYYQQ